MKGLVKKDLYVLMKQMRVFLLLVLVFSVIPGGNMVIFAVVYAAMMPYTALAYDERSHWDQLAGMMPYSIRDIVLSKYVLGWIFTAGAAGISLLASLLERPFLDQVTSPQVIGLAFCIGILTMSVTLPLMFRFGVERGRMFFVLLMVFLACGSVGLLSGIVESQDGAGLLPLLSVAVPAAALLVTALSIPLSMFLYQKRS